PRPGTACGPLPGGGAARAPRVDSPAPLGSGQVVRQLTLDQPIRGSNPLSPASERSFGICPPGFAEQGLVLMAAGWCCRSPGCEGMPLGRRMICSQDGATVC